AGGDRDRTLDDEGGGRPQEDWKRAVASRQDQRRQRRLVRKLEQEDDGEDGKAQAQCMGHARSLAALWADQWSQSGKERQKTSRPSATVRIVSPPAPWAALDRRDS